jgi:hypothetical protein
MDWAIHAESKYCGSRPFCDGGRGMLRIAILIIPARAINARAAMRMRR